LIAVGWVLWLAFVGACATMVRRDFRDPNKDKAVNYAMASTAAIIALLGVLALVWFGR
jgi:hypothetical protein